MTFEGRTSQGQLLVSCTERELWQHPQLGPRFHHVAFGYETHVDPKARQALRFVRTPTTRYVRFAPDFFVIDRERPDAAYLIEYKVTQTPIALDRRVDAIARASGRRSLRREDIGQWEQLAHDNYTALAGLGIRIAVMNHCPYHARTPLCEFVDRITVLMRADVTSATATGSRTPFVNIDLASMRALDEFLVAEHGTDAQIATQIAAKLGARLRGALPVKQWAGGGR